MGMGQQQHKIQSRWAGRLWFSQSFLLHAAVHQPAPQHSTMVQLPVTSWVAPKNVT